MKMKILLAGLCCSLLATTMSAQEQAGRFKLDTVQRRITLQKDLPGKGKVLVQMAFAADWQGDAEMQHLAAVAATQLEHLKPSFKDALAQKKVYLELPQDESYTKIGYEEILPEHKEMVYTNNRYHSLKTVQDTVFILKHYGQYNKALTLSENTDTFKRSILYTFVLNDVAAFDAAPMKDSIAQVAPFFTNYLNDPRRKYELKNQSRSWRTFMDSEVGLTYFNDRLGLAMDAGYGVLFNRYSPRSFFVMAKLGLIANFRYPIGQSNTYLSYNVEFGSADMSTDRGLCNRYAIGLGFFQGTFNPKRGTPSALQIPNMFRMYINIPVAPKLNLGLDLYSNFILKQDNPNRAGMIGLYLKYNL